MIWPDIDFGKACYHLDRAIVNFNGDLTRWSAHFTDGVLKYRMGRIYEARDAFKRAIYYNPVYEPANKMLKQVEKSIENREKMIKNFKKKNRN
jgi:hypothetical protein